jgi:hypothetical protein
MGERPAIPSQCRADLNSHQSVNGHPPSLLTLNLDLTPVPSVEKNVNNEVYLTIDTITADP